MQTPESKELGARLHRSETLSKNLPIALCDMRFATELWSLQQFGVQRRQIIERHAWVEVMFLGAMKIRSNKVG